MSVTVRLLQSGSVTGKADMWGVAPQPGVTGPSDTCLKDASDSTYVAVPSNLPIGAGSMTTLAVPMESLPADAKLITKITTGLRYKASTTEVPAIYNSGRNMFAFQTLGSTEEFAGLGSVQAYSHPTLSFDGAIRSIEVTSNDSFDLTDPFDTAFVSAMTTAMKGEFFFVLHNYNGALNRVDWSSLTTIYELYLDVTYEPVDKKIASRSLNARRNFFSGRH